MPTLRFPNNEHVFIFYGDERFCYKEALEDPYKEGWVVVVKEELRFLYKKNTFKLVDKPCGRKVLINLFTNQARKR